MPRATRQRNHNEWFRAVLRGGRKTCSNCRQPLPEGELIWSWGEYRNARFRSIRDCCVSCWPTVARDLRLHTSGCGCTVTLCSAGSGKLPDWMTLELPKECAT